MRSAPKYSVVAAAVMLSLASFSTQAVEIKVIPKGASFPSSLGVQPGSMVCGESNGGGAVQAVLKENNGRPSALSFANVASVGSAGSSIKVISASENNPVSLSSPGCRYITMTIDRGTIHDGEYDLSDPDSAVKVDYAHVFTYVPGQPGATVVATYEAKQGRAHVVYDKVSDQLSATFDFATTVEPLPRQWGVGYPSAYPVSITSGSVVGSKADFPSCYAAWDASSARLSCEAGTVTGSLTCQVKTRCFNKQTTRYQDAGASGSRETIGALKNCNGNLGAVQC